jgi:hypothetical protein
MNYIAYEKQTPGKPYIVWGVGSNDYQAIRDARKNGYGQRRPVSGDRYEFEPLEVCRATSELIAFIDDEGGGEVPMRIRRGVASLNDRTKLKELQEDVEYLKENIGLYEVPDGSLWAAAKNFRKAIDKYRSKLEAHKGKLNAK